MKGKLLYQIYRTLTYTLSPLLHLHVRWRKLRGLDHPLRWPERLGHPSLPRPPGSLLWFHAVSLGEGMAAIPVIEHCNRVRPDLTILMTTTTLSAFEVIKNRLPQNVIYQFAPYDSPSVINTFLSYWKPNAVLIMENEIWPNLIMYASSCGVPLVLLNARVSVRSLKLWSKPIILPLISLLLSQFSLIVPLSNAQAINFQLLQAPPFIINFSGDLKYVVNSYAVSEEFIGYEKVQLANRKVWIASSLHRGEEEVILGVHKVLVQMYPDVLTIIVPRYPQYGQEIAQELQKQGENVMVRSRQEKLTARANIFVVDTLGELGHFYRLSSVAVIGGSFFPGSTGHNICEAAATGCAVVTGHHLGHFSHMVQEMKQLNPLSVLQVSGKLDLEETLKELLSNSQLLKARQTAAMQTYHALSVGIIANVWNLLNFLVFNKAFH